MNEFKGSGENELQCRWQVRQLSFSLPPRSVYFVELCSVASKEMIELLNIESWTNCIRSNRLILGCINADFCNQRLILQHFSSSTCVYPHANPDFCHFSNPLHRFSRKIAHFFNILRNLISNLLIFRKIWMNFDRNFAEMQRSWGDRYRKCSFF